MGKDQGAVKFIMPGLKKTLDGHLFHAGNKASRCGVTLSHDERDFVAYVNA